MTTHATGNPTLKRIAAGRYETPDGRFQIEHDSPAYTTCDNPHPMSDGSFHEGGEEHEYFVWQLNRRDDRGEWEKVDCADTKRELVDLLFVILASES